MKASPLLRWAGSKRRIIPRLQEFWSDGYNRYFEPFAGSAHLFYSINAKKACLSDTNYDLIQTYRALKKKPRAVFNSLVKLRKGKRNYYKIRKMDPDNLSDEQRAARFIYLNRFCFNGLYRTNSQGEFNVPYSGYKTGSIPEWPSFKLAAKKLGHARLICQDFERVLRKHVKRGDFVYMDPPYAVSNRRIFKQYNAQTFGLDDLRRVSALIDDLNDRGAHFVVSYAYCAEALELFDKWNIRVISTQRFISGFGKFRKRAKELLVTNIN